MVRVVGWCLWSLGLLYAGLGIVNGEFLASTSFRDATIQKHDLWHEGTVSKVQARAAMSDLNERHVAMTRRVCWTLTGLLGGGSILLFVGRKRAQLRASNQ